MWALHTQGPNDNCMIVAAACLLGTDTYVLTGAIKYTGSEPCGTGKRGIHLQELNEATMRLFDTAFLPWSRECAITQPGLPETNLSYDLAALCKNKRGILLYGRHAYAHDEENHIWNPHGWWVREPDELIAESHMFLQCVVHAGI